VKLVVNSNINYRKPLGALFDSLLEIGFEKFEEVVVVVGGHLDLPPRMESVSAISDCGSDAKVVVVGMKINNYDYTGYHALNMYINDPMLSSDGYFYSLDTVTFEQSFVPFFRSLSLGGDELRITGRPHSNICAFGPKVVQNYGENFGITLDKDEAIRLEYEMEIPGKTIKGISSFGELKKCRTRIPVGEADIYGTGIPRKGFLYPDFGMIKWILWGKNGDIVGDLNDNKYLQDH
jgi:hypothetical protein